MFAKQILTNLCDGSNHLRSHFEFTAVYGHNLATGMYLPLTSVVPLFIGSLLAKLIKQQLDTNKSMTVQQKEERHQFGFLIASGLLCGAALMEVVLASVFAWYRDSEILRLLPENLSGYSVFLAILTTIGLFVWIYVETTQSIIYSYIKNVSVSLSPSINYLKNQSD